MIARRFTSFMRLLGVSLTMGQSAVAAVAFDGLDPVDLLEPERAAALAAFGGAERIPSAARRVLVLRCGRGSGKTLLCAGYGLFQMLTADLSACGPGDTPACVVIAPGKRNAKLSIGMALGLLEGCRALANAIVSSTSEQIVLRRPHDGRRVALVAIPKSRGGAAARGLSLVSAIIDESEFMPTDEVAGATVTDREIVSAITPRLLREGRVLLASTPWPVASLTSELFEANHGRPTNALAARAPTLLMRDNDPHLAEVIAAERERDPANAAREYDCMNITTGATFFDAETISRATSSAPIAYSGSRYVSVGCDVAFRGDSSTLVAVERQSGKLVVVRVEERRPEPGRPLVPSKVLEEFAAIAKDVGGDAIVCDGHYIDSVRETAARAGIQVHQGAMNTRGKERSHVFVRELLREGRLVLPPHLRLLAQIRGVRSRPQPGGGLAIVSDRTLGGHGDLVSALVQACYFDLRFGPLDRPAYEQTHSFATGASPRTVAVGGVSGEPHGGWGARRWGGR